jgi:hypothetical protein
VRLLDLDQDRAVFARLIADGVRTFNEASPPPLALPVTRVDIRFDLLSMADPCVWVVLDTEPNGEPDSGTSATWQLLERWCEHWAPACQAVGDEPVTVRSLGRSVRVADEEALARAVGGFFVALAKSLRDFGAFNDLPRAAACYLGVSAVGGGFGWPAWEDRGPDNMA